MKGPFNFHGLAILLLVNLQPLFSASGTYNNKKTKFNGHLILTIIIRDILDLLCPFRLPCPFNN